MLRPLMCTERSHNLSETSGKRVGGLVGTRMDKKKDRTILMEPFQKKSDNLKKISLADVSAS